MQLSIGEQLKQARIARNASIEDVSRSIHIRPYFVEALEEDRFSEIPSQAQVKGFIRLYADWLELPSLPLLNAFEGKPDIVLAQETAAVIPDGKEASLESSAEISASGTPISQKDSTSPPAEEDSLLPGEEAPITSQALFSQIGIQLRTCREKLNISVEDIEKLTHIRSRYLLDMEAGNFNDVPSLVQARGLLNGYAAFLNLDSDSLLGIFAEALQKRRIELLPPEPVNPVIKKKNKSPSAERTGIKRFFTVDFIIGSVTITGLVIFGIWSASQVISSRNETFSKPPAIADVLLQNPTSETRGQATTTSEPTVISRNPDVIGQIPTTMPNQDAASANASPTPPVPSLGKASMQVYIVPNQRVFLQVITGKKVAFLGRTVPGNAYPFTSDERIEVVSGNAAALQVYYNQRDLGTLGLPGQPLRLIFSKEGITTPTSAITTAPTRTPLATLTLQPSPTQVPPTVTPLIP